MHAPAKALSRKIRTWIGLAVFAALAVVVAAEALLQLSFVRERIRARAETALGRRWPGATIERCAAADVTGVVRFDGVKLPVSRAEVRLDGLEVAARILPLLRGRLEPARVRATGFSARAALPGSEVVLRAHEGGLAVAVLGSGEELSFSGPLRVRLQGVAELCAVPSGRCLVAQTFGEAEVERGETTAVRFQAFGDDVRVLSLDEDTELPLPPLALHGELLKADAVLLDSAISVGPHGNVTITAALDEGLSGETPGTEALRVRVDAKTDRYAALIESIPLSLEPIHELGVDGPVSAWATLAGPPSDPQAWEIDMKLDLHALRAASHERGAGAMLRRPFLYKPSADPGAPAVWMGEDNPDFLALAEIPERVQKAVLLSEDTFFLTHSGFDAEGIVHALKTNLREHETRRGGSTVTQQLAKNLWLTRERTFRRKFEEALLTIALEAALSKERILEIYLNGIEWGPGVYGVRAASRHYFAKEPADLSPKEAAYLATVIPSPRRYYAQFTRGELTPKWEERVMQLLLKMHEGGFLTDEELDDAAWTPLRFTSSADDPWTETVEEPSWERFE